MIIRCPFCLTRVQPTPQGRCPACLREVTSAAEAPGAGQQPEFSDWTVVSEPAQAESDYEQVVRFFALMDRLTPRVWVTPTLIAINAVVFLGLLLASGSLSPRASVVLEWGANFGPRTLDGQWWRLFSAMFLHFGILHVALNMWALWNLGQLVERLTGNVGFLILYLVSGAAGCVASLAWNPDVLGAGASGAVFGVGGALAGFLATRRDSIPLVLLSRLRSSMLGFIVINVVLGFMIPFIDNAAHLGGLAAGFLCGLGLSQPIGPEMARARLLRNVLVAMAGGLLLGLAFHFLPAPPGELGGTR